MPLTLEDIRTMSLADINSRWPEVREALATAAATPRPATPAPGELTREHLRWLTAEEIADRWGEVGRLLSDNREQKPREL